MARTTGAATDLITFSRASSGTALTKVAYGPELVTNGGFDTDSDWVLPVGASISNGTVILENVGTGQQIYQSYVLPVGVYEYTFDLVSITSGAIQPFIHGAVGGIGTVRGTVGTYTETLVITTAGSRIAFRPNNTTSAVVDNVSVKQVLFNDPTGTLKLISHPTNKPRVEYDANGVAKGLLIEEARTNLLTYSIPNEAQAVWTTLRAQTQPSAILAPNGLAEARLLKPTISSSGATWIYSSQYNTGVIASISVFAKASGKRWLTQSDSPGNVKYASFDLENGVIGTVRAGYTASMQDVGNGWYRCSVTTPTGFNERAIFAVSDLDNDFRAAVSGDDGILLWGAQLETGSFPTSYIPTSGATATRSADLASVSVSEFGYNQAQGALLMEFNTFSDGLSAAQYVLVGGHDTRFLYSNPGTSQWYSYDGAVSTYTLPTPFNFDDTPVKAGYTEGGGSTAVYHDGNIGTAAQNQTIFDNNPTVFDIGQWGGIYHLNGHVKSINYYPLRLSDAKLQELTS